MIILYNRKQINKLNPHLHINTKLKTHFCLKRNSRLPLWVQIVTKWTKTCVKSLNRNNHHNQQERTNIDILTFLKGLKKF